MALSVLRYFGGGFAVLQVEGIEVTGNESGCAYDDMLSLCSLHRGRLLPSQACDFTRVIEIDTLFQA